MGVDCQLLSSPASGRRQGPISRERNGKDEGVLSQFPSPSHRLRRWAPSSPASGRGQERRHFLNRTAMRSTRASSCQPRKIVVSSTTMMRAESQFQSARLYVFASATFIAAWASLGMNRLMSPPIWAICLTSDDAIMRVAGEAARNTVSISGAMAPFICPICTS